jgi:hypothetical protein
MHVFQAAWMKLQGTSFPEMDVRYQISPEGERNAINCNHHSIKPRILVDFWQMYRAGSSTKNTLWPSSTPEESLQLLEN